MKPDSALSDPTGFALLELQTLHGLSSVAVNRLAAILVLHLEVDRALLAVLYAACVLDEPDKDRDVILDKVGAMFFGNRIEQL